jgi:biopolymer transport protein ExbD
MNLYGQGARRQNEAAEVEMTAVMNIFLVLIPFLILTAAFVRITVLQVSLPTGSGSGAGGAPPPQNAVLVILVVTEDGKFQLQTTSSQSQFDPLYSLGENKYDFEGLVNQLKRLKTDLPGLEEIILRPEENVKYEVVVKVMDRCREEGFPNISFA